MGRPVDRADTRVLRGRGVRGSMMGTPVDRADTRVLRGRGVWGSMMGTPVDRADTRVLRGGGGRGVNDGHARGQGRHQGAAREGAWGVNDGGGGRQTAAWRSASEGRSSHPPGAGADGMQAGDAAGAQVCVWGGGRHDACPCIRRAPGSAQALTPGWLQGTQAARTAHLLILYCRYASAPRIRTRACVWWICGRAQRGAELGEAAGGSNSCRVCVRPGPLSPPSPFKHAASTSQLPCSTSQLPCRHQPSPRRHQPGPRRPPPARSTPGTSCWCAP
jgi:hypothetical protein